MQRHFFGLELRHFSPLWNICSVDSRIAPNGDSDCLPTARAILDFSSSGLT